MWQIPVRQKGTVAKPTAIFKPGPRSPSAKKNEDRPWTPTEAGSGTGLVVRQISTVETEPITVSLISRLTLRAGPGDQEVARQPLAALPSRK